MSLQPLLKLQVVSSTSELLQQAHPEHGRLQFSACLGTSQSKAESKYLRFKNVQTQWQLRKAKIWPHPLSRSTRFLKFKKGKLWTAESQLQKACVIISDAKMVSKSSTGVFAPFAAALRGALVVDLEREGWRWNWNFPKLSLQRP